MRYLLIDAYNVICATDPLREVMQGKLDTARDQLAEIVLRIHDAEAVHVALLVLDSRNDKPEVEHPYKVKTLIPLRTRRLSADGVIERMVAHLKNPQIQLSAMTEWSESLYVPTAPSPCARSPLRMG